MNAPAGFLFAGMCAGIKAYKADLALVLSTVPCAAAGVFTQNRARAACVEHAAASLPRQGVRAIVTNAGNANALSGEPGRQAVREVVRAAAQVFDVPEEAVLTASTGVIGVPLPWGKITAALPLLRERADSDPRPAAEAILTTDTRTKLAQRTLHIDGKPVHVLGFCKGAGMIHPALATMLGYVLTDAAITAPALQGLLRRAADRSFNRLTVDGDMSTNDSLFALASGLAGNRLIEDPEGAAALAQAIEEVCVDLARAVAADGEGATKRIEVRVEGAADDGTADDLARAVAGSSLVKAALFGNDPNWGRVLSTIGARAAGRGMDVPWPEVRCAIQGLEVFAGGGPCAISADELRGRMTAAEVTIDVTVGRGPGKGVAWGCDLTYDYVKVNAEYVAQTVAAPSGTVRRDDRLDTYGPTFKHRLLVEALSYIRRFTGQIAVIRYGGEALLDEGLMRTFAQDVLRLRDVGLRPVVVHGGGEELVTLLNQAGHLAVGMSGHDGRLLEATRTSREILRVRPELLTMFLDKGYIPVISPVAIAEDGAVLAVETDDAAAAVAGALHAHKLIYLCEDVAGLLRDGALVSELPAAELHDVLGWPALAPGMAARLRAAARAIEAGVSCVHLIDGRVRHALIAELFTDAGVGTLVRAPQGKEHDRGRATAHVAR
jgi:acetylglutamate kinase